MAKRNVVFVSIFAILILFLQACGGGENKSNTNGPPPPTPCKIEEAQPFDGDGFTVSNQANHGEVAINYTLATGCYTVDKHISITSNAILTIQAGTTIFFSSGAGIDIKGGSIIAEGFPGREIYFTSQLKQPGTWNGIRVLERHYTIGKTNFININPIRFNHVVIEYAGGGNPGVIKPASLVVFNQSINKGDNNFGRISILNSIIRYGAAEYALYALENSYFTEIKNNYFYGNKGYPVLINYKEAHFIDKTNRFEYAGEKNTINKINVDINGKRQLDSRFNPEAFNATHITWQNIGIPYLFTGDLSIHNTNITIEPGAEIQFTPEAGLTVSQASSSIFMLGTLRAPIKLTLDDSLVSQSGIQTEFWKGLRFLNNASSPSNRMDYTYIEYGGKAIDNDANEENANLVVGAGSQVSVSNSRFEHSGGYGIHLVEDSIIPEFENNIFLNNAFRPALVSSKAVRYLTPSNEFNGLVVVKSEKLNGSDTWKGLGRSNPYYFRKNFIVDTSLTIEGDATLLFDSGVKMEITGPQSGLVVKGTSNSRIEFTSFADFHENPQPAYWQGIVFNDSSGSPSSNEFEYVDIFYAGAATQVTSFSPKPAAVKLITDNGSLSNSRLIIRNSSIGFTDFGAEGVFVDEESSLIEDGGNNSITVCRWDKFNNACSFF